MRERVELHGGRFKAGPTTPRGFRVHAWLPLQQTTTSPEHDRTSLPAATRP